MGWCDAQVRSCLSVDSDGDGTSGLVLRQSRLKRFVKIKSRSERSMRSTAISMAISLRRTKHSTAGHNPNPYNLLLFGRQRYRYNYRLVN